MVKVLEPEEGYNQYSAHYAKDHRKLDLFDREVFISSLPEETAEWTVDLGVGDGRLSEVLQRRSRHVVGVDIAADMLRMLRKRHPMVLPLRTDLSFEMPFRERSIDLVTAAFFLVHIHDPRSILGDVYRVLKPGGQLVFNLIPQRREPELGAGRDKFKIRSYYHSPPAIEKMLDYFWFDWNVEPVTEGRGWVSRVYRCVKV